MEKQTDIRCTLRQNSTKEHFIDIQYEYIASYRIANKFVKINNIGTGVDSLFLERGFRCINGGRFADFISFLLDTP